MTLNKTAYAFALTAKHSDERDFGLARKALFLNSLNTLSNETDTELEKLRKAYFFIMEDMVYKYNDKNYVTKLFAETDWVTKAGTDMLNRGFGDCYNYTGAIAAYAELLGFKPIVEVGFSPNRWGEGWADHSWAEVVYEGSTRYLDPSLAARRWKEGKGDYFMSETTPANEVLRVEGQRYLVTWK